MEFSIKKLPKSQLEIEIKVPTTEFQGFIDKTISQLGQHLEVEGFRKGKIPKEIIEKNIGQDKILREATQLAIKENYFKVFSKNKFEAIANPEIHILSPPQTNKDLLFRAKISILPEIALPDYRKIAVGCKKREISVQDKEVEESLLWLQRSRAKFSQVSRPAQKGDFVEIEFSSPDIEAGTKQKDAFLLGQGHLIPGFEEKLEQMKTSEEKKFSLKFPQKHFQKDLVGRETNFEVKMISVQKMEPPQLNDQFAQSLGKFENLAALKRNIVQGLSLEKEVQEKQRLRQEILKKVIEEVSWEIPNILIESEQNRMLEGFKKEIDDKLKINFEEYLKKNNQTEETVKQSFLEDAETRIKGFLVLNKISALENIQVPEEEIKDRVNKIINKYQDTKEAKKEVDLERLKLYIEGEIKNEKTLAKLESFSENS